MTSSWIRVVSVWGVSGLGLCLLPWLFGSGAVLSAFNLMAIMVVLALSYNVLYGQTGMLSFGHAVYYGLGGYVTTHVIRWVIAERIGLPVVLFPIVGGLSGLFFAAATGWFITKRSGTTFAMITLGIGELVIALSLIMPGFFGEEDGFSINRMRLAPFFGVRFGSQLQIYYLMATWCFVSVAALYGLRRTPFGLLCSAVRENPERSEFIGINSQLVRYMAFCIAGFFAGLAGSMAVVNFEIINTSALSGAQSGSVLLMTYIGGTTTFLGPVIGAVLITLTRIMLSDYTDAWLMYYGILFILVVMFMPGGIAGWLNMHVGVVRRRQLGIIMPAYALVFWPLALTCLGGMLLIELSYGALTTLPKSTTSFGFFGVSIDERSPVPWWFAVLALAIGGYLVRALWPRIRTAWRKVDPALLTGLT